MWLTKLLIQTELRRFPREYDFKDKTSEVFFVYNILLETSSSREVFDFLE